MGCGFVLFVWCSFSTSIHSIWSGFGGFPSFSLYFLEDFFVHLFLSSLPCSFPLISLARVLFIVYEVVVSFLLHDSTIELLLMVNTNGLVAQQVNAHFGFGPLCAYLSINYLDRFLSAYELPVSWNQAIMALLFGISLAILYVFTGVLRLIPFWFHLV